MTSKDESPEKLSAIIEDHFIDAMSLKRENEAAKTRIAELEFELHTMTVSHLHSAKSDRGFEKPSYLQQGNSIEHEETRKKDIRSSQAALLVAEQDAVMIKNLEFEILELRAKHEKDVALIQDYSERMGALIKENQESNKVMALQSKNVEIQKMKIDEFTDQLRRRELQLEQAALTQKVEKYKLPNEFATDSYTVAKRPDLSMQPELGSQEFLQFGAQVSLHFYYLLSPTVANEDFLRRLTLPLDLRLYGTNSRHFGETTKP